MVLLWRGIVLVIILVIKKKKKKKGKITNELGIFKKSVLYGRGIIEESFIFAEDNYPKNSTIHNKSI